MIVAGGVGLALRPVVLGALAHRERYGRVVLIAGARTGATSLPRDWPRGRPIRVWRVHQTVDVPIQG